MAECCCLSGGFLGVSPCPPPSISSKRQSVRTRRANPLLRRDDRASGRVCMGLPPLSSPSDPFLRHLAEAAQSDQGRAQLADARKNDGGPPPLLDMVADSIMMAAPAQVGLSLVASPPNPLRKHSGGVDGELSEDSVPSTSLSHACPRYCGSSDAHERGINDEAAPL